MKMRGKEKSGITLIALIITIIVLLILAGVSIATLTGENGILTRANEAKEQTEIASEKEKIGIAYTVARIEAETDTKNITVSNIQKELDSQFGEGKTITDSTADGNWLVTIYDTDREYIINKETGKIDQVGEGEEVSVIIDQNPGVLENLGNNIYQISSIEDLVAFSYEVNSGTNEYEGKTVTLGRRLDFSQNNSYVNANSKYEEVANVGYRPTSETGTGIKDLLTNTSGKGFIPIGLYSDTTTLPTFKGNLDGKGNYIANIYINSTLSGGTGIFGEIVNDITISDFGIESGNITGKSLVGGLIGKLQGSLTINNCYNNAKIVSINGQAAGFLGMSVNSEIKISESSNRGKIQGASNTGGLIGIAVSNSNIEISDCYNTESINGIGSAGGMVGYTEGNVIAERCYNTAKLESESYSGGIIGIVLKDCEISDCYNTGLIISQQNMGAGICGSSSSKLIIQNCSNEQSIEANTAGGICGMVSSGEAQIINCVNKKNIKGKLYAGGILANANSTSVKIQNCYNSADIIESEGSARSE